MSKFNVFFAVAAIRTNIEIEFRLPFQQEAFWDGGLGWTAYYQNLADAAEERLYRIRCVATRARYEGQKEVSPETASVWDGGSQYQEAMDACERAAHALAVCKQKLAEGPPVNGGWDI
jgi:hypothetical protein